MTTLTKEWRSLFEPGLKVGMHVIAKMVGGAEVPCLVIRNPLGLNFQPCEPVYGFSLSAVAGWKLDPAVDFPWWHFQASEAATRSRQWLAGTSEEWIAWARAGLESLLTGERVIGGTLPPPEGANMFEVLAEIAAGVAMAAAMRQRELLTEGGAER